MRTQVLAMVFVVTIAGQIAPRPGHGSGPANPPRTISRLAFLQEYNDRPADLIGLLPEVKRKGYQGVVVWARIAMMPEVRKLIAAAHAAGLPVTAFTGYQKYDGAWLAEHPEQKAVLSQDRLDQDGLSSANWGCPFQPAFKQRYLEFLGQLARTPGVVEIWVNDEATLGNGCYCRQCRESYRRELGGPMPLMHRAAAANWKDPVWRRFLKWRIERWNRVHGEMNAAIAAANPRVRAVFQTSPSVDICWDNPWRSGVDLTSMVRELDGLCTDPYYTYHARRCNPAEVYLSEWCRFLYGIVPEGKQVEIIPQGWSHPTFTRPLEEKDGLWAAIIPAACGANVISPYTYPLMKTSPPVLAAYEKCFPLDRLFAQVKPLAYAGLVHGSLTEMYRRPLPAETPGSYDGTRLQTCADALRHRGIPYEYLPDQRLDLDRSRRYAVLVLPELDCLDDTQARAVVAYWHQGGNLLILGCLGTADATGGDRERSILAETFGIEVVRDTQEDRSFRFVGPHVLADAVPPERREGYIGGIYNPIARLRFCKDVKLPAAARMLAEFTDAAGASTGLPAIAELATSPPRGRVLYIAGFPSRTASNWKYSTPARNLAHGLVPAAVEYLAGRRPALRVEGWPPTVPMDHVFPTAWGHLCSFEFFPLSGQDQFVAVLASYCKEPARFDLVLDLPPGRTLHETRELIADRSVGFSRQGQSVRVPVEMGFDTPLRVFLFSLSRGKTSGTATGTSSIQAYETH